jgi:hypothetical protein
LATKKRMFSGMAGFNLRLTGRSRSYMLTGV